LAADAVAKRSEQRFPCVQCGAVLRYSVAQESLKCNYCGCEQEIEQSDKAIVEHDFQQALRALEHADLPPAPVEHIGCDSCGAHFSYDQGQHAGECPFCSAPVVVSDTSDTRFKAESLLPFSVTEERARSAYKKWLKSLWFAPGKLKKYARSDQSLNGVFLPYWTYDSDTRSRYSGERGETYYVIQWVTVVQNGRHVRRKQRVPKVRWHRVSGRVSRHFDDVLVGASDTLPRQITDKLRPWDLHFLVPYDASYLSGMRSEMYQVPLDEGFGRAQQVMKSTIVNDVRADIGGEFQRVHNVETKHSNTTFKHVLLPVWTAAFRFSGKHYRFVVNGRTAKVHGERPYSKLKIALAVIAALIAAGVFMMALSSGEFSANSGGYIRHY